MKKLLTVAAIFITLLVYNTTVNAYQVLGVEIEYGPGSYFTDNGKACTDHGVRGKHSAVNESACNCKCTYGNYKLGACQCFGYARYMQVKLFGTNSYINAAGFEKKTYNGKALTVTTLKNIITNTKPGAHIRTGLGSSGYNHSLIITSITENGFSVIDCNSKGSCLVDARTYTWQQYVSSGYGSRGIIYVELPKNYTLSPEKQVKPVKPASPVIKSVAAVDTTSIRVQWEKQDNIIAYRVDRGIPGRDPKYETVETLPPSSTEYVDKNLQPGSRYDYRVYAQNIVGWSDKKEGYAAYTLPDKTVIEKVSTVNTSKLTVKWKKVTGATSYLVKRRKSGTEGFSDVRTMSETSMTDSGLDSGCGYWYQVVAINESGCSAVSEGAYGMTKCAAPSVKAKGADGFTVSWKESVGKTKYQYAVYRKKEGENNFQKIGTTEKLTYDDTGLEKGKKYTYKYELLDKDGGAKTMDSEETTVGIIAVPGAPSIKASNYDNGAIAVSWDAVKNATSYQVYRKVQGDAKFTKVKELGSTSYLDTSVTAGKKYEYYVTASNASGTSGNSNQVSIGAVVAPPSTVTCTAKSATSIEVTWSKVSGAEGYLIRRMKEEGDDSVYEVLIPYIDGETTSYTDKGLAPSTKYRYKIKAWTGNECSDSSNPGKATTLAASGQTLESPVMTLTPKDTTTINISWKAVSGAKKYEVYRRRAGEDYPSDPTYTTSSTSVNDKNLKAGIRYWYRVYAVNGDKKSSKPAGIMCYTYPEQPKINLETIDTKSIKVTWNSVQGANNYILDIRKSGDESYSTVTNTQSTSYVVGNLESGTKYLFRVYAVISDRSSFVSKLKSAKPDGVGCTTKYDQKTCTHKYGDWKVDKQPTCTEKGVKSRVCSLCNYKDFQATKATGHTVDNNWITLVAATCEQNGVKHMLCNKCKEEQKQEIIKATGHQLDSSWITETAATCKAAGKKYRKCKNCSYKEYEVIPQLEHKYEVTKKADPTDKEAGRVEYTCAYCKDTYTDEIPKLNSSTITGVSVDIENIVLKKAGSTKQITATVTCTDQNDQAVEWCSSDTSVVTVSESGLLTAVSEGEAIVIAKTANADFWDVCEVQVDYATEEETVKSTEEITTEKSAETGNASEIGGTTEDSTRSRDEIGIQATTEDLTKNWTETEGTTEGKTWRWDETGTEGTTEAPTWSRDESGIWATTEELTRNWTETGGTTEEKTWRWDETGTGGTTEALAWNWDESGVRAATEEQSRNWTETGGTTEETSGTGQQPETTQNDEKTYQPILEAFTRQCQKGWDMETDFEWNPYGVSSENLFYLEDTSKLGYCFRDLDGDGVNELIISEDSDAEDGLIYEAYTCRNQKISQVLVSSYRGRYYLTADQSLRYEGSDSAFMSTCAQYQMRADGTLQLVQAVIYNAYADRNNPWLYSQTSADYNQAGTAVGITEAQAVQYKEAFKAAGFPLKNFMDSTPSDGGQKPEEQATTEQSGSQTGQVTTEQSGSQTGQVTTEQSGSQTGQTTTEQSGSQTGQAAAGQSGSQTGQAAAGQSGSQTGQISTGQSSSQTAPSGQKATEQKTSQQIMTGQRTTEKTAVQSTSGVSQSAAKPVQKKNTPARFSLKNRKAYKKTKKLVIKEADGIRAVKINGHGLKNVYGKTKVSFKLSKYKKYFRKKGKWNRIIVTDAEGRISILQIKIK